MTAGRPRPRRGQLRRLVEAVPLAADCKKRPDQDRVEELPRPHAESTLRGRRRRLPELLRGCQQGRPGAAADSRTRPWLPLTAATAGRPRREATLGRHGRGRTLTADGWRVAQATAGESSADTERRVTASPAARQRRRRTRRRNEARDSRRWLLGMPGGRRPRPQAARCLAR